MNNFSHILGCKQATKDQVQFVNRINRNLADPLSSVNHVESVSHVFGLQVKDSKTSTVWHVGGYRLINSLLFANSNPDAEVHCTHLDEQSYTWLEELNKEKIIGKNVHFHSLEDSNATKLPKKADYINFSGLYYRNILPNASEIFSDVASRLSNQGLLIVDYPVLPGASFNSTLSKMFCFYYNENDAPATQCGQAVSLLKFIEEAHGQKDEKNESTYLKTIKEASKFMTENVAERETDISRIVLDYIIPHNPGYFVDFLSFAAENKLRFVAETNLASSGTMGLPKVTRDKLKDIKNFVNLEQYMDFITNRRYRQSILCSADMKFEGDVNKDSIANIGLISLMRPEKPESIKWYDKDTNDEVKFVSAIGGIGIKDHHLLNTLYVLIHDRKNNATTPESLISAVQKKLNVDVAAGVEMRQKILTFCAQMAFSGLFFMAQVGESKIKPNLDKPMVNPLVADLSMRHRTLPNRYYFNVEFDNVMLLMIRYMNGQSTRSELTHKLITHINKGDIVISSDIDDKKQTKEEMAETFIARQCEQLNVLGFLQ